MMEKTEQHLLGRPMTRCPACGSERLEPVVEVDTGEVRFLCDECARCWYVEFGYVQRMASTLCHGCPNRDRCEPVYFADHVSS
jgi:transposase-like protein